ncbi:MAG: WD40 repeat domain-containing protein, partial [Deltaproteobacteria bacterium]|nr:WD40 repeat domain-containing protein [Deltaproteobacteria bacterium]
AHRGPYELSPTLRVQLPGPADAVALSPDGKRIAVAMTGVPAQLLDGANGKPIANLEGIEGAISSIAFSSDGTVVALAGPAGAYLFDGQGGEAKGKLDTKGAVAAIAFTADGSKIATGEGRTARVYDLGGHLLAHLEGHAAQVTGVAFPPDGRMLVTADDDGAIRAWSPLPSRPGQRIDSRVIRSAGHAAINGLGFAPGGKVIVTGANDGTVRFYDADSTLQLVRINGPQGPIKALSFSTEGPIGVLGSDSTLTLADAAAQALVAQIEGEDAVTVVGLSADGTRLASANRDGRLRLWSVTPGARIIGYDAPKGFLSGSALAVSPNGKRVAVGDSAGHIVLWDVSTGK